MPPELKLRLPGIFLFLFFKGKSHFSLLRVAFDHLVLSTKLTAEISAQIAKGALTCVFWQYLVAAAKATSRAQDQSHQLTSFSPALQGNILLIFLNEQTLFQTLLSSGNTDIGIRKYPASDTGSRRSY